MDLSAANQMAPSFSTNHMNPFILARVSLCAFVIIETDLTPYPIPIKQQLLNVTAKKTSQKENVSVLLEL